jgi:UDP-glucose 4-epimerase
LSDSIRKVLVTGGAGFIGSHIVERLLSQGYDVGVVDNLATGSKENLSGVDGRFRWHSVDIRDWDSVMSTMDGYDAVVHEGALVSVTRSVEDPLTTNATNVDGTVNVLKAAVDCGVKRLVYASSSSVYGETETLPKQESMPTRPVSPYAVSKLAAEGYCRAFAKVYGIRTVSLRYFNVYGPRQKAGPYSGVIPAFIKQIGSGASPVVFGDGEQTRDFTFVDDVVEANLLSLTRDVAPGSVFNIGSGRTHTINQLAGMVARLMGREELKPTHSPERPGDVRASFADISAAEHSLGYRPKYDLETGLARIIALVQGMRS